MKSRKLLFKVLAIFLGIAAMTFAFADVVQENPPLVDGDNGVEQSSVRLNASRANQVTGEVNPLAVQEAIQQARNAQQKASQAEPTIAWQFCGPDNVGGKVNVVLWDGTDPEYKTMYAGAASGGLYKTTTKGSSWSKINAENANLKVSALAQDASGTIYAGTGGDFSGDGLYKSTDGDIFTVVDGTAPSGDLGWFYSNEIAVLANSKLAVATERGLKYQEGTEWMNAQTADAMELNGFAQDVVYASDGPLLTVVDGKVYVSLTGDVLSFVDVSTQYTENDTVYNGDKLPFNGISTAKLAIAPSDHSIVYASLQDDELDFAGLYRSADKGMTWTVALPVNESVNPIGYYGNNEVVVFPEHPDRVVVAGTYVWIGESYLSTGFFDFGTLPVAGNLFISGTNYLTSPKYLHENINDIQFRPSTTNEFIVATDGGFYFTEDGATSFYNRNKDLAVTQLNSVGFDGDAPGGHAMVGTNGNGTQYISDGNTPFAGFEVVTQGLMNTNSGGDCAISTINSDFFIYSIGNGTMFYRSEDRGYAAATTFFSDDMAPDGLALDVPAQLKMWESFDMQTSGDSVTYVINQALYNNDEPYEVGDTIYPKSNNYSYPFIHVLESPVNDGDSLTIQDIVQNRCFVALNNGTSSAVYMTTTTLDLTPDAIQWWAIGEVEGIPTCIEVSQDGDVVYVGTDVGNLYRFANVSLAYSEELASMESPYTVISQTLVKQFEAREVTSVSVDPYSNEHVIVTLGNYENQDYVYRTTNGLDEMPAFTAIDLEGSGLPNAPVFSSLIYATEKYPEAHLIFVGTEVGLYVSDDFGTTWAFSDVDNNMGIVPVMAIEQQLSNRPGQIIEYLDISVVPYQLAEKWYPAVYNKFDVYVATYGRGLYCCDYASTPVEPSLPSFTAKSDLEIYPNPVRTSAVVEFTLEQSADVTLQVVDLHGRIVMHTTLGNRNQGVNTFNLNCSDLSNGTYLVRMLSNGTSKVNKFIKVN